MTKIISSTGTNSVEVASQTEAKEIQNMLGQYGIKVGVQAVSQKLA